MNDRKTKLLWAYNVLIKLLQKMGRACGNKFTFKNFWCNEQKGITWTISETYIYILYTVKCTS